MNRAKETHSDGVSAVADDYELRLNAFACATAIHPTKQKEYILLV